MRIGQLGTRQSRFGNVQFAVGPFEGQSLQDDLALSDTLEIEKTLGGPRSYGVTAIAIRTVRVGFTSPMTDNVALINPANYTITDMGGAAVAVSSASRQSFPNHQEVILLLSADLVTTGFYSLTIGSAVKTGTGLTVTPTTALFEWIGTRQNFSVAIGGFGGEVQGGLFGNHGGLVFFSPAFTNAAANSVIQVEDVEVCTTAYDSYHFPQLVDPSLLFTFTPNAPPSPLGAGCVLFAPWQRLAEFRVNFNHKTQDLMPQAASHGVSVTLNEPWDHTFVSLLNNPDWKTFDDTSEPPAGPFYFRTAINTAPIPPGPLTTLILEAFPQVYSITLNDSAGIGEEFALFINNLNLSDVAALTDLTTVEEDGAIILDGDGMMLSDTGVFEFDAGRALSDTAVVTDEAALEAVRSTFTSDTAVVTDEAALEAVRSTFTSDTAVVTDEAEALSIFTAIVPATEVLTLWLKGGQYTLGTWTGSASAGPSLGRNIVNATPADQPSVTTLNALAIPNFDKAASKLTSSGFTIDQLHVTDFTAGWLVKVRTTATDSATANSNVALYADYFNKQQVYLRSSLGFVALPAAGTLSTPIGPLSTWVFLQVRQTGTSLLEMRTDGGAWTSVASAMSGVTNGDTLTVGSSAFNNYFFDGEIAEVFFYDSSKSDAILNSWRVYLNNTYGVAV